MQDLYTAAETGSFVSNATVYGSVGWLKGPQQTFLSMLSTLTLHCNSYIPPSHDKQYLKMFSFCHATHDVICTPRLKGKMSRIDVLRNIQDNFHQHTLLKEFL